MGFVKDRDEAFIDFVMTGNTAKVTMYCKKYNVQMPKNPKAFATGIYKAMQYCPNIPDDIKDIAVVKCVALGMSPFINTDGGEEDAGN